MEVFNSSGVLIDVCPECRGVWLDHGEMEKLLSAMRRVERDYERERKYNDDDRRPKKRHKKESVLERLLDLFD